MMTLRKSVRPEIAQQIPALTENALVWMRAKYPNVDFGKVEFIFSAGYSRSRYFRNEQADAKYMAPNACISTRAILLLYDMKTLNLRKTKLFVGSSIQIMCALIHELTHHAQYEENRSRGELETTANELAYLSEHYPKLYNKLVKTK